MKEYIAHFLNVHIGGMARLIVSEYNLFYNKLCGTNGIDYDNKKKDVLRYG